MINIMDSTQKTDKVTFAGINNLKNSFNLLLSVVLEDLLEPDRELSSKIQELGQNSVGVFIKLNLITSGIEEFVKKKIQITQSTLQCYSWY